MKIEEKLLNAGKKDLESSLKLYEVGHYNNAVFLLQQSVEKCVKSYGIAAKVIEAKDLAGKISHLPHKVFTREFKKKIDELNDYKKGPLFIADMIPPHQRGKGNYDENIDFLQKLYNKTNYVQFDEMEDLAEDEIKTFIESGKEIKFPKIENEKALFDYFKDDWIKTNEHFLVYFKENLKRPDDDSIFESINYSLQNPDFFTENRVHNYKFRIAREAVINHLTYVWFNLSILTAPHEQKSRYPSEENSLEEIYTHENIIVKYFIGLTEIMKFTIEKYEETFLPKS